MPATLYHRHVIGGLGGRDFEKLGHAAHDKRKQRAAKPTLYIAHAALRRQNSCNAHKTGAAILLPAPPLAEDVAAFLYAYLRSPTHYAAAASPPSRPLSCEERILRLFRQHHRRALKRRKASLNAERWPSAANWALPVHSVAPSRIPGTPWETHSALARRHDVLRTIALTSLRQSPAEANIPPGLPTQAHLTGKRRHGLFPASALD